MSGAMNYEVLSKEIIRLAELTNNWSSTIIIPQGDAFLNISSAAQGKFLLLLMVQLISLMYIPKVGVHRFIASIQIFLVKMTGQN